MGVSRNGCTNFVEPPQAPFPSMAETLSNHADQDYRENFECDDTDVKFKSFLYKMIWDFGLGCVIPHRRRLFGENLEKGSSRGNILEHKAWLLAESGGCRAEEPHSVHSSFRFNICSQVELESMTLSNWCSYSATVLMVNLDGGFRNDSKSRELRWRRIQSLERNISPVARSLIRFSYTEILSASRNFSKGRILGRGALSCVFRGRVGFRRTAVAIKRLNKEDQESSKAFCRELMIAGSLRNHRIVPLVGFCIDADEGLFLVYKYVSGGSLEGLLHGIGKKRGVNGGPLLSWSARYRISTGIAEAIQYLHNGTERCVVHRDIKPSNILLSSKKTPKLCDFGLALWTLAPSVPFLCKTVKGTFGYLAPEYFQHGKVSDKTDVYAFGIVLLELITGRKPIEMKRTRGEENLVLWAKPLLQQRGFEKFLDPRLKYTRKNINQISRMVHAANSCLNNKESRRPEINEIVAFLRGKDLTALKRKKGYLTGNNGLIDTCPQRHWAKNDMENHVALAMLGVDFDDDNHHNYP
ncbi:pto-interacting protein 1-like isoform X1 [Primulina huaijiensis]|uniref:pto-interacting protein 1-like isoform X1 n=1 Tax=Primulina huaijiensis TaxID=1492673 RepID=UPI003CC74DD6